MRDPHAILPQERRYLVPRSVFSARIEHRCPAGSVKCQHLIPFWRPSWDLHAGRTHRHPKDGDARDGRAIAQEPINDVGRHMALDDVIRDERRVAGSQGGGDAKATAEWCEILDVLRRNRVSVVAQVSHPRAATPSGRRPVDGDGRSGAGRGTSQSRLSEGHGQHAQDHRPSFEPHSVSPIHPAVMAHFRHVWIETTAIRRIIRHEVDPSLGYAGRRIEDDTLAQDSLENLNQAGSRRDALK